MIRRKRSKRGELALVRDSEEHELIITNLADPRPGPLDLLRAKQEHEVLQHAIGSLPATLREGLEVRCNEELSVNEIATLLHLSLPATKTRLLRARNHVVALAGARLLPQGHSRRTDKKTPSPMRSKSVASSEAVQGLPSSGLAECGACCH